MSRQHETPPYDREECRRHAARAAVMSVQQQSIDVARAQCGNKVDWHKELHKDYVVHLARLAWRARAILIFGAENTNVFYANRPREATEETIDELQNMLDDPITAIVPFRAIFNVAMLDVTRDRNHVAIALLAHAARRFVSDMNVNTSSNRWRNMNKPGNRQQLREKAKVVSSSITKRNVVFQENSSLQKAAYDLFDTLFLQSRDLFDFMHMSKLTSTKFNQSTGCSRRHRRRIGEWYTSRARTPIQLLNDTCIDPIERYMGYSHLDVMRIAHVHSEDKYYKRILAYLMQRGRIELSKRKAKRRRRNKFDDDNSEEEWCEPSIAHEEARRSRDAMHESKNPPAYQQMWDNELVTTTDKRAFETILDTFERLQQPAIDDEELGERLQSTWQFDNHQGLDFRHLPPSTVLRASAWHVLISHAPFEVLLKYLPEALRGNILTESMLSTLLIRAQIRPPPKARVSNACRDQAVLPLYKVLNEMETIIEMSQTHPLQHELDDLRRVLIEMSVENFYTMAGPATSSSRLRCEMRPPKCKTRKWLVLLPPYDEEKYNDKQITHLIGNAVTLSQQKRHSDHSNELLPLKAIDVKCGNMRLADCTQQYFAEVVHKHKTMTKNMSDSNFANVIRQELVKARELNEIFPYDSVIVIDTKITCEKLSELSAVIAEVNAYMKRFEVKYPPEPLIHQISERQLPHFDCIAWSLYDDGRNCMCVHTHDKHLYDVRGDSDATMRFVVHSAMGTLLHGNAVIANLTRLPRIGMQHGALSNEQLATRMNTDNLLDRLMSVVLSLDNVE